MTNTPLQKSGDSAGDKKISLVVLPTFHICCIALYIFLCDIFLCNFGITVLYVMIELLDIQLLFALVICEMSSIPEFECT